MVWAIVFRVRIADRGRSMSFLSRFIRAPHRAPRCLAASIEAGVTVRRVDSSSEQRNETTSARRT